MGSSRVFILGAGFSAQAGMPLATELTPLLRRMFEKPTHEASEWLTSLDERIRWIRQTDEDAAPSLNIEELFDYAHFDALLWKMRQHTSPAGRDSGPYSKGEAIGSWLKYMEDELRDVIWDRQQKAGVPTAISRFTDILRAGDTIITFNYDTLVEQSTSQAGKPWQYGFTREHGKGISVLKMHGSINWAMVLRDQAGNFGFPVLFRKEGQNAMEATDKLTGKVEYDALLRIPDEKLAKWIEGRIIQRADRQYEIGIAGLGRYKPLDALPGSGEVWANAERALDQVDEVYVIGFFLSPFDTMARLHFAGVMSERAKKQNMPQRVVLIDPYADSRLVTFRSVFGPNVRIEPIQKPAEEVDWSSLLGQ